MRAIRFTSLRAAVEATAPLLTGVVVAIIQVELHGLSPVGLRASDLAWAGLLGVIAGTAATRAPVWAVVGTALLSLGFVESTGAAVAVLLALITALFVFSRHEWAVSLSSASYTHVVGSLFARILVAGGLTTGLFSLQDHGRPFLSAAVAIVMSVVIAGTAFSQLSSRSRSLVTRAIATTAIVSAFVVGSAAWDLYGGFRAASAAETHLRNGLSEARSGELEAAQASISVAVDSFEKVTEPLSSPFVVALTHAPITGPNLEVAQRALEPTAKAVTIAQGALTTAGDLDSLVSQQGLAVDELLTLAASAEDLLGQTQQLQANLEQTRSMWILRPLQRRLDAVSQQVSDLETLSEASLVKGARSFLGAEEQRSYLVLFANTAEARELGGFVAGLAVISIDDGDISLERADRPQVLDRRDWESSTFTEAVPQRFLEHNPWLFSQNYSAMADFPTLATAVGDLYPIASGTEIDGVAYIDQRALGTLVGLVGEVYVESQDLVVTAENFDRLVSINQYELDFETIADREQFRAELIAATFTALFDSEQSLDLSKLNPILNAVRQDRLLFAPFNPDEFAVAEALGLTGGVPEPRGQDYLAVSHLNGGPNKLDVYMDRAISYDVDFDPATGDVDAIVEVTLTNNAPEGLPLYPSNNEHGYPQSTNRATLVVHTPHDAVSWTGGDEPALTRSWEEFGWQRHEQVVVVPRGESRTVILQLDGQIAPGDYTLDLGHQPLATNDAVEIQIEPASGILSSSDPRLEQTSTGIHGELELTVDTQFSTGWTSE